MTFIDIVLLIAFLATVSLGFSKGAIKVLIGLISFYASVVLAGLYFQFLSVFFTRRGANPVVANGISFFLLLIVTFVMVLIATLYTFRYLKMPGRLDYLDRILGTALAIVLAVVATGIVSMVLNYVFVANDPAATSSFPLESFLQTSVRDSMIRKVIVRDLLPKLYASFAPFLPDTAASLFNPLHTAR